MYIQAIRSEPLSPHDPQEIAIILDKYIPRLSERSVLVVTSKIIAICEKSFIAKEKVGKKEDLVPDHADFYIPASENKYGFCMTITRGMLTASAGIDESNGDGYYILWPRDAFASAAKIWRYLRDRDSIEELGIVLSDSCTRPLRWGVTAQAIGWCGFEPLKDYRQTPDIFDHHLRVTQMNIVDHLASMGAFAMGEGNECTPFALIQDIPHIMFTQSPPTKHQIAASRISLDEDLYSAMLKNAPWKKGNLNPPSSKDEGIRVKS